MTSENNTKLITKNLTISLMEHDLEGNKGRIIFRKHVKWYICFISYSRGIFWSNKYK